MIIMLCMTNIAILIVVGVRARACWLPSWHASHPPRRRLRRHRHSPRRRRPRVWFPPRPPPSSPLPTPPRKTKKMASDCGAHTLSLYETTLRGKRRRFSAFRGITRGNKDGCGMRGGGGTRRGRSVTSGPTCRPIIILMMMILGKSLLLSLATRSFQGRYHRF